MTDQSSQTLQQRPWFKQPWLWLVLLPIIMVFIMSAIGLTFAVNGADVPVQGKYKKEGRLYVSTEVDKSQESALEVKSRPAQAEKDTQSGLSRDSGQDDWE